MYQIPDDKQIDLRYETEYVIEDEVLTEPFHVLKAVQIGRPSWWNGPKGREKLLKLIQAFKADMPNQDAFVYAGIHAGQYVNFCKVHRNFQTLKERAKRALFVSAKIGIVGDVKTPGKDGANMRRWFLERREPQRYGPDIGAHNLPPPVNAAAKLTAESYLDADGKMIVSRQTAEMLEKEYGNEEAGQNPGG